MHANLVKSQVETLREWATNWEREADMVSGAGEVAFLLRRAARNAEATIGIVSVPEVKVPGPTAGIGEVPRADFEESQPHVEDGAELRHG